MSSAESDGVERCNKCGRLQWVDEHHQCPGRIAPPTGPVEEEPEVLLKRMVASVAELRVKLDKAERDKTLHAINNAMLRGIVKELATLVEAWAEDSEYEEPAAEWPLKRARELLNAEPR